MIVDWCWILSKRRKTPGDPLFEEGNIFCCLATKHVLSADIEEYEHGNKCDDKIVCSLAGCDKTFDSLRSYEAHYNSLHRNVCGQCKRAFPCNYLLEIHIQEWHDSMFELLALKQPMYHCLLESCSLKFSSTKERKNHMIKQHKYPSNYRFDKEKKPGNKRNEKKMEVALPAEEINAQMNEKSEGPQKRQFTYKIPDNICFGQGVSRGFQRGRGRGRGRGKKNQHWHNKHRTEENTSVDIEKVDMMDLADALDNMSEK